MVIGRMSMASGKSPARYAGRVSRSVVVAALRTPFGRLGGALKDYEATQLGAHVIRASLDRIGMEEGEVQYVIMGQVLQAGAGQAPARQAAVGAGLPKEVPGGTRSTRSAPPRSAPSRSRTR
jgi:acetyl-CoA acetyltransferase